MREFMLYFTIVDDRRETLVVGKRDDIGNPSFWYTCYVIPVVLLLIGKSCEYPMETDRCGAGPKDGLACRGLLAAFLHGV